MRQYHTSIPLLFFVCLGVLATAQAQLTGGYPGAPFRMGFGAKGMGTGNAAVAERGEDFVGYYNPALIPFQEQPTVSVSVGILSLDRSLNFLSYTQRLKPAAGLSFGIINAGVRSIEGRDRDGVRTETYSTSENAFLFSFGLRMSDAMTVGVTTKVFYYSLFTDISSTTVGFDLGVAYDVFSELRLGVVVHDLGSKYRWETTSLYGREGNSTTEYFPVRIRVGASYSLTGWRTHLSLESELVRGGTLHRVGFVQPLGEALSVRAGIDQISLSGHISSKPSVGMSFYPGWTDWRPAVHYALVLEPYAPSFFHLIAVSISFP